MVAVIKSVLRIQHPVSEETGQHKGIVIGVMDFFLPPGILLKGGDYEMTISFMTPEMECFPGNIKVEVFPINDVFGGMTPDKILTSGVRPPDHRTGPKIPV